MHPGHQSGGTGWAKPPDWCWAGGDWGQLQWEGGGHYRAGRTRGCCQWAGPEEFELHAGVGVFLLKNLSAVAMAKN